MPRPPTEDDFRLIYDSLAQKAVENFNAHGELVPVILEVVLNEPGKLPQVTPVNPAFVFEMFNEGAAGMERLGQLVRLALTRGSPMREAMVSAGVTPPDLLVQINEAWVRSVTGKSPHDVPRDGIPPSEHPDRKEAILVLIHTPEETVMGSCPILENPRRAEFAPIHLNMKVASRFSVPQKGDPKFS